MSISRPSVPIDVSVKGHIGHDIGSILLIKCEYDELRLIRFFGNISKTSKGRIKYHSAFNRNSIGLYLVPGLRKSVQQFSHNTPKRKSGTFLKIDISVCIFFSHSQGCFVFVHNAKQRNYEMPL